MEKVQKKVTGINPSLLISILEISFSFAWRQKYDTNNEINITGEEEN